VPLLLPLAIALVAWVAPQAAEEDVHPDVNGDTPCDVCHAEMTPEVHQEWYAGRHGKNNVKCFVCHGSIGDDFTKTPPAFRCISCHADQVATIEKQAVPPGCFDCHPPHLLSPHVEGGDK
jgi:hypothetical protein